MKRLPVVHRAVLGAVMLALIGAVAAPAGAAVSPALFSAFPSDGAIFAAYGGAESQASAASLSAASIKPLVAGWSIQENPATAGTLSGVSCASATACMAVGSRGLTEEWNGTEWTVQATPNEGTLKAVSCSSATACIAVGNLEAQPLAESWNGTTWSVLTPPALPAGATHGYLVGVSCTSGTQCTATGESGGSEVGAGTALVERLAGTEWAIQETPSPAEARSSALWSVSCTSATECTAAGNYAAGAKDHFRTVPMAERWDGTSWALQTVPSPSGAPPGSIFPASQLFGLSCSSSTACNAVGKNENDAPNMNFAVGSDGTSWAVQTTPDPTGENRLLGVSCSSATACTATGATYEPTNRETLTLAEAWDGTAWSVQSTPTEGTFSELRAVSCTSETVCTAVGNGGSKPLIERHE
jgi:hypothetical protein